MDVLEKLLLDLNQSIEARDQYSNCSSIISSIESIALSPLDTTELEICTGYLIHSENPPSIVEYLIQTSRFKDREIIKAKVSGLKFLANYVKIYPEICSIHVEYLITTLIDAYKKEESGEVKAALLLPLKNILRVRIPSRASTSPSSNNGQFIYPPLDSDAIKLNVLYTALIDELRFGKKVTKGMTCESLKLLGIVVAVFPSHIITISTIEKIIDLCNGVLKSNINSSCKDPDFPGIAGAFSCLDRVYFQHEDKCTNTAELWGYLLKTIDKVTAADISRYAACEKAIRFVKNHSVPFQDLIGINASQTYDIVYAAHNSDKKSILKHSEEALNAIIAETAEFLVKNTQSEESQISKAKHAAETVYKLLNGFLKIVKDTSQYSNSEALFYALKGIILIAPAIPRIGLCLKLKEPVNCSNLIYVMMDCANQYQRYVDFKDAANAGGDVGKYGSYAYRKSLFLSSTASLLFACFLDGIQDVDQRSAFVELMLDHKLQVFLDEYITQSLIGYVRLWKKQQYLVNQSLVKITLICLFGCSDGKVKNIAHTNIIDSPQTSFICNEILTNMIKTLLIRSVGRNDSQATIAADSMLISNLTGEVEDHLFGYYISCSRELLAPNHQGTKTTVLQTIGASAYQLMQEKLVDILLLESITMIKSLDLSYVTSEEVVDDGIPWLPTNIMDQDIMINFALFFSALIPFVKKQLLFNRLHYTLEPLMELSKSYPLVSSFYSIVQCVLTAVEDYITYSIPSISKYLKFVQFKLEGSITDFKGELLDSAIKLILSAPLCLLSSEEVISVVKTSLTSGVQVLLAIKLLMKYLIQDSNNVLKYIGDLLPLMSKYLTPNDIKSVNTKGKVSNEDEEKALKYTLLDFLGRLGSYNKSLLESPDQALQNSFSWSQEVFLTISLNTTTSIVLDEVFVSLIHDIRDLLAASTMNQQLTTCAEALHSMTMILIGKTGTFANKRESPYPVIWSGTIPILLKLSVKGLSCQSLFETLMLQLTRWFGTVGSVHVDDVSAFLESIFSSLCAEESDASEREFSSRILLEYFQWSMRQNTSSSKITSNLQDFFGKVVMLLSHPSEFYQRGGVAIVTKIYRLLREDNLLVNRYGMQLFYLLLKVLHQTPSVSLVKVRCILILYFIRV